MTQPNTTPLNEELDKIVGHWVDGYKNGSQSKYYTVNNITENLLELIQTLEKKAREEAVNYFYWRIDCNTLISELEGWRGCIDNAKDQTERHFSELGERGTPPNKYQLLDPESFMGMKVVIDPNLKDGEWKITREDVKTYAIE